MRRRGREHVLRIGVLMNGKKHTGNMAFEAIEAADVQPGVLAADLGAGGSMRLQRFKQVAEASHGQRDTGFRLLANADAVFCGRDIEAVRVKPWLRVAVTQVRSANLQRPVLDDDFAFGVAVQLPVAGAHEV